MSNTIPPSYQSPISLDVCNSIDFYQHIHLDGINKGSQYNSEKKIFEVQDKIFLKVNGRKYQLDEYHFHNPSEHKINGMNYEAEIHYVFIELEHGKNTKNNNECLDICNCCGHDENILVIGRTICESEKIKDLTKIQVKIPDKYYEYDGSLTTGNYSPVRWIVGENHIHFNITEISKIAKTSRPLQNLDGRILLYYMDK